MFRVRKTCLFLFLVLSLFLVACNQSVEFSIYFNSNGGSEVTSIKTGGNSAVEIPSNPTKEGYIFGGWYWDNNTFTKTFTVNSLLEEPISSNMTVYAKWSSDDSYTISFDSNGGTEVQSIESSGNALIAMPNSPTKVGYTFAGWYWDNTTFENSFSADFLLFVPLSSNVTVYAKWVSGESHTISFDSNGGTEVQSIESSGNALIAMPNSPTKVGYTFAGWYWDNTTFENSFSADFLLFVPLSSNVTVYAKWVSGESHTISFDSNGGTEVQSIESSGNALIAMPNSPTKVGYTFAGWYWDNTTFENSFSADFLLFVPLSSNVTVYAKWASGETRTISFDSNGGTEVQSIESSGNASIAMPNSPTKVGHTFAGWYSDLTLNTLFTNATMPAENITLYAKWTINQYTLEYVNYEGTVLQTADYDYNIELSGVTAPSNPTRTGYTFTEWDTIVPSNMPASKVTITALYTISEYIISFNTSGGNETYEDISKTFGTTISTLPIPTKTFFTFGGWSIDSIEIVMPYVFDLGRNVEFVAIWLGPSNDITYEVIEDKVKILSYIGTDRNLVMPDTILGLPITIIGESAFANNGTLKSLVLGSYVETIENYAFLLCESLTNIVMPASLTTLGYGSFGGCTALTSITVDAENLYFNFIDEVLYSKDISRILFYPGGKTETEFAISASVTSIGDYAFAYASSLTSITIPNSVTSIGDGAFSGASSLTSITIPNSVTSIGKSAFYYASSLISITISEGVVSIGESAFEGASSLTSITIPNSVTSIGESTFSGASSLTSITIPNSVTSIGNRAFSGASSLTSIVIPEGVTSIGNYAFYGASSLTSITIPNSVTSIGNYAFREASSLTSITILEGVTSIGDYAFRNASSLTSITIPNSVTSIGEGAFYEVSSLTSIIVSEDNNNYYSIDGVLFDKNKETLIAYPIGHERTTYTIPNSVTSIGYAAFYSASILTSITIPNSVTSIGESAFYYASSLTSITIPNSVTSIGNYAFRGASSLTSIVIPEGVTSIGECAFEGASSLIILAKAQSEPSGWDSNWNINNRLVIWGYVED